MLPELIEGFLADVVLHPAGVRRGGFGGDAQRGQPVGQAAVALVDALGDFAAASVSSIQPSLSIVI